MGIEAATPATFITHLTKEWPTAGEPKSQGDDHLRLIKTVLQNTFPNASGPFYLPTSTGAVGGVPLTITVDKQNQTFFVDTAAGNVAASLPVLTGANTGWSCEIIKITTDQNAVTVTPPSGTILSSWGAVATVRVGAAMCPAKLIWTGTFWLCAKAGPLIGSTENFDGVTVPSGYLTLDGTVFNAVTFAELNLALGTTTLRDKRGRTEVGVDTLGLLTAGGVAAALGSVGGTGTHTLTIAQMAAHRHSVVFYDPGHYHTIQLNDQVGGHVGGGGTARTGFGSTINADANGTGGYIYDGANIANTHQTGTGSNYGLADGAHPNVQPTIVVQKLIRAC